MKVIVCKDDDAEALIAKMKLKERELIDRFAQQDAHQRYVATEVTRGLMYVLIDWLQAQGFKTS
jgi:hypothetical protein